MKNRALGLIAGLLILISAVAVRALGGAAPQLESMTYQVEHKHGIGAGRGELRITIEGIEYRGENEKERKHGQVWRDEDIKRISIAKHELSLTVYEAATIPIIPGKVPLSGGGKAVRAGTEHEYSFKLIDGEIDAETVRWLLNRFNRSIATTVLPKLPPQGGLLIFEIPVFHRHRAGGESGLLLFYDQYIIFNAEVEGHTRYWRYTDIRDIGRLGRDRFELATYEGGFGTDGKSYIFDLKRPMIDAEYDALWNRVYQREKALHH